VVNASAFETPAGADLVDTLREKAQPVISLVAQDEDDGAIVGHIMFSPVSLSGYPELRIMDLAPMAVAPGHQGYDKRAFWVPAFAGMTRFI